MLTRGQENGESERVAEFLGAQGLQWPICALRVGGPVKGISVVIGKLVGKEGRDVCEGTAL